MKYTTGFTMKGIIILILLIFSVCNTNGQHNYSRQETKYTITKFQVQPKDESAEPDLYEAYEGLTLTFRLFDKANNEGSIGVVSIGKGMKSNHKYHLVIAELDEKKEDVRYRQYLARNDDYIAYSIILAEYIYDGKHKIQASIVCGNEAIHDEVIWYGFY